MPLDVISRNAIFSKIINYANLQLSIIESTFRTLTPDENPMLINELEKTYKSLSQILPEHDSDLEGTVKRLNSFLHTHFSMTRNYYVEELKDAKKTQYFEDNPPLDYEKLLQACLKKGEELLHVLEHGKTLNDFKKIPDINLKPAPFLIKTYRRGSKNEDEFYKAVATAISESESNFRAIYGLLSAPQVKVDTKLVNDVLNRIKYALYEQFKANPDLLSVKE